MRAWIRPVGGTLQRTVSTRREDNTMSGTTDDMKGRAKEAAGAITDDDDLKREGKTDRAAGKAKDKLEDAKDWVEDKVDDVRDSMNRNR